MVVTELFDRDFKYRLLTPNIERAISLQRTWKFGRLVPYFRGRHIGQSDPAESIPARRVEFRALSRHLPSVAPNRTTNALLQNVKSEMCSSKYPSGV